MIHPVILCGGAGTRMWPSSRENLPKQFLSLFGDESLYQTTLKRVSAAHFAKPLIIANNEYRFLIEEQTHQPHEVILEPLRRNSAPAIAIACLHLIKQNPQALVMILPSDHLILNKDAFQDAVLKASEAAKLGHIVTFGLTPDKPHTGFGYIERGAALSEGVYKIHAFHEKPKLEKALELIAKDCAWNSGMFIFRADIMLQELAKSDEASLNHARLALETAACKNHVFTLNATHFSQCTNQSIDYAVMEKTSHAAVVPASFGWSDVGNWASVWEASPKDANGNAVSPSTVLEQSKNCYVRSDRLQVNLVGCENLVVIAEKDAIMIAAKDKCENVKDLVAQLAAKNDDKLKTAYRANRPWGWYESIDTGVSHQAKHICVKPQGKLSLQSHKHRAEHWVVVVGTAIVTRDHEEITVKTGETIYLPLGCVHRLYNPTQSDIHIIEVQYGDYFGEDDIIRYEDIYNR